MEMISTSLAAKLVGVYVGFSRCNGGFILSTCLPIGIVSQVFLPLLVSLIIARLTVDAYHEQLSTEARWKTRA